MVRTSVARRSAVFGAAIAVSHIGQFVWIVVGARVLGVGDLGKVLAAQALYGLVQILLDNGSSLHGARLAAMDEVTPQVRDEVGTARLLIAIAGLGVSLPVLALVAGQLLEPFAPYVPALLLFALLNVWEPYGRGRAEAYASYMALRSTVLAVFITVVYVLGSSIPLFAIGCCEIAAIAITALAFRAWTIPRQIRIPSRSSWQSIRAVGGPSLLTQATYSVGTLVLGAAGQTTAAAVAGVGTRLLTGLQGLNGSVTAGLFPTIAGGHSTAYGRAARFIPVGIVTLCLTALAAGCLLGPRLPTLLLGERTPFADDALLLWLGGAAASGYVMHLAFVLVAQNLEAGLVRRSAIGLVGALAGAVAAAIVGGREAAVIAGAGFLFGQVSVLLAVARRVHACSPDWLSLPLVLLAAGAAPLAAVLGTFWSVGGAAVALVAAACCLFGVATPVRPRWASVRRVPS